MILALISWGCSRPVVSSPDGEGADGIGQDGMDGPATDDGGAGDAEGETASCLGKGFASMPDSRTLVLRFSSGGAVAIRWFGAGVANLDYFEEDPEPPATRQWVVTATPVELPEPVFSADCEAVELDDGVLRVSADISGAVGASQLVEKEGYRQIYRAGVPPSYGPDGSVSLELEGGTDRLVYGFGEKTGPLERSGRRWLFYNTDPLAGGGSYGPETDPTYQSVPFMVVLEGAWAHGLLVGNTHRMEIDLGQAVPSGCLFRADGGTMDLYLLAGPRMDSVLERYTMLTGRMELPPRWTLGFHQCRWSYWPDERVRQVAAEFRARNIPADGIWLDIDYMDGFRSFTWDPVGFPDPHGLIAELEAIGFKTTAIIDPGLKVDPGWQVYDEGVERGWFLREPSGEIFVGEVWPGPAAFPDFSSAGARSWWAGLVPALTDAGVRGLWIDMNEPATFLAEHGYTVPDRVLAEGDGRATTMAEIHNVYALLMARATREGMERALPGRRPFLLTRAGFAGIQRYAAVWTGDSPSSWPMLRENMVMLLSLGLSGVSFCGSDVGGFSGGPSPELYARWLELGAISPFFRAHVQTGAPDHEPWSFGIEVEDIARSTIGLRYRLLPYLYTLFHHSAERGEPILAPLVYWFQQDPESRLVDDEAMLGPWLLAAPVLEEGVSEREIYLPAGRWYEFHSGRLFQGPGRFSRRVTLAALPLFVREGAILPLGPPLQWSDQAPLDPLELRLYPSQVPTEFYLYEDDGETTAWRQGEYSRTAYVLRKTQAGAELVASRSGSFTPTPRNIEVCLVPADWPAGGVELNGERLAQYEGLERLRAAGKGWYLDSNARQLWVVFEDPGDFLLEMEYSTDGQDHPTVRMPFDVEVPEGTAVGEEIYIASSASGWYHVLLGTVGPDMHVAGTHEVPRGEWFEYKYTRGSWETVEKWNGCVEADNRYALGVARPVKFDRVETWADWCP